MQSSLWITLYSDMARINEGCDGACWHLQRDAIHPAVHRSMRANGYDGNEVIFVDKRTGVTQAGAAIVSMGHSGWQLIEELTQAHRRAVTSQQPQADGGARSRTPPRGQQEDMRPARQARGKPAQPAAHMPTRLLPFGGRGMYQ